MKGAVLKFGPGEMTGFPSHATAAFNDIPPAKVVRELVQNSLDAAVAAQADTAHVRFEVLPLVADDVPDLAGYRRAFEQAVRDNRVNGRLPDAAQHVVDNIESALQRVSDGNHWCLAVLDNGIGLNVERMTSLLGDGRGVKEEGAAGSYGVGHFAAFSASDLRYLLYGGVLKSGKRLASGSAILASRYGRKMPISGRGYLVKKLLGGERGGKLYQFMDRQQIPQIVDKCLTQIQKEWGNGSVVIVPAFNYFGRQDWWLSDVITKVAAYNFSAAIYAGDLVVEVDEDAVKGGTQVRLDRRSLADVLEQDKARVRAFRSDSPYHGLRPSGQSAWSTGRVLIAGNADEVPTPIGHAEVHVLTPAPAGATRIDLFRNGMWITDDIPDLGRPVFAEWQPFHAVLMPRPGDDLHRLVRKAEGTMHDSLAMNRLAPVEREKLQTAFRAIATWLKNRIPRIEAQTYTPDDFLVVSTGGNGGSGGDAHYSMWGSPVVVQRSRVSQRHLDEQAPDEFDVEKDRRGQRTGGKRKRQATRRRSRPLPFRSTGVPTAPGRYEIEVECAEAVDEVLLRLRIDENTDATCDRLWPEEGVVLKSFEGDGPDGVALSGQLEDANTTIRLRALVAGKYKLAIKYDAPKDFDRAVRAPVFRINLHKPQG